MMVSRRSELRVHVLCGVLLSTVLVHASVSPGLLAVWWLCVGKHHISMHLSCQGGR